MSASASSANREPALRQYLKDLSAIPPMQPGEEAQISARIRAGDKSARTRLIEANLRFVVAFAKKYRNLGLPFQDLINAGNVGMIEAAKRFDPDNGAKFITYAVWWIKQSILQTLSGQNAVFHLPQKQASLQLKLARTTRHLQSALEHNEPLRTRFRIGLKRAGIAQIKPVLDCSQFRAPSHDGQLALL